MTDVRSLATRPVILEMIEGKSGYETINEYIRAFFEKRNKSGDVVVKFACRYRNEDKWDEWQTIAEYDYEDGFSWPDDWDEAVQEIKLYGIAFVDEVSVKPNASDLALYREFKAHMASKEESE